MRARTTCCRTPRPPCRHPAGRGAPPGGSLLSAGGALRAAENVRALGWDPPSDAYDAACTLAECISIAHQREQRDDAQRQAAMRRYADRAMALLRDAVAKGWKDTAQMKKDTDLDALRPRADFQQLLNELERNQPDPQRR